MGSNQAITLWLKVLVSAWHPGFFAALRMTRTGSATTKSVNARSLVIQSDYLCVSLSNYFCVILSEAKNPGSFSVLASAHPADIRRCAEARGRTKRSPHGWGCLSSHGTRDSSLRSE